MEELWAFDACALFFVAFILLSKWDMLRLNLLGEIAFVFKSSLGLSNTITTSLIVGQSPNESLEQSNPTRSKESKHLYIWFYPKSSSSTSQKRLWSITSFIMFGNYTSTHLCKFRSPENMSLVGRFLVSISNNKMP